MTAPKVSTPQELAKFIKDDFDKLSMWASRQEVGGEAEMTKLMAFVAKERAEAALIAIIRLINILSPQTEDKPDADQAS